MMISKSCIFEGNIKENGKWGSRGSKDAEAPRSQKVFDDECKKVESRLASLPSLDALVDQYCTPKYSSLEQALSSSSSRNSQLARELREWEAALK